MKPIDYFMFFMSGSIILGFLAAGVAYCRYAFRVQADATALARERLDAQFALKRELIQRGLSPQELEQALKSLKLDEPPDGTPAAPRGRNAKKSEPQLEAEILQGLTLLDGVSAEGIEQVFGLVRGADREKKEAALDFLANLNDYEQPKAENVLAAVRALCRPVEKPRPELKSLELSEHITR